MFLSLQRQALVGTNRKKTEAITNFFKANSLPLFFIALHFMLATYLAFQLPVWRDEGGTLAVTANGTLSAIRRSIFYELQPPAYYIFLSLWRKIHASYIFARLLSVVFTTASLFVSIPLIKRFIGQAYTGIIVAVFAFSPFLMFTAVEIRVYAFCVFLSAAHLLLFHIIFFDLSKEPCFVTEALFILTAVFMLYTQYYLGFLMFGQFFSLLLLRNWKATLRIVMLYSIVAFFCLPLVYIVPFQFQSHTNINSVELSILQGTRFVFSTLLDIAIPHREEYSLVFGRILRYIIAFLIISSYSIFWKKVKTELKSIFLILCFSSTLFIITVLNATGSDMMTLRHLVGLFVPLIILLFGVASILQNVLNKPKAVFYIFSAVVISFTIFGFYTRFNSMTKLGSLDRVASYIQANEQPGDTLYVYPPQTYEALSYHYSGMNTLLALPESVNYDQLFSYADPKRLENEFYNAQLILNSQNANGKSRIWLITNSNRETLITDENKKVDLYEPLIQRYGLPQNKIIVNGTHVRLFR